MNFIIDTDSYKASHYLQYPQGTTDMYSYIESRGGDYPETVFFGLQGFLKSLPLVTVKDVLEAEEFFKAHGEPFPLKGWMKIAQYHEGVLPIRIKAVKEGSIIPTHNVLVTVESTDPEVFWIVSWIETQLMRAIWYPTTVATRSHKIKRLIYNYLQATDDDPDGQINFKLHDFGSRGVSSRESAMIGGAAHLVNFMGSDTCAGVWWANQMYNEPMSAFSIPAAEHSTITAWGKDREAEAYGNMLKQFAKPGSLVAVVSDSYDIYNAVEHIWGEQLRQQVIDSGATLVVRPDSGYPPEVVREVLFKLDKAFGSVVNSKGYKVLNNVRVIQGDGVNEDTIADVLRFAYDSGFSASNIAFGMGGALLQQLNRDTLNFAMKLSAIKINGIWNDVSKNPVGSHMKKSKAGRLALVRLGESFQTINGPSDGDLLEPVFENGRLLREQTLSEIRNLAWKH